MTKWASDSDTQPSSEKGNFPSGSTESPPTSLNPKINSVTTKSATASPTATAGCSEMDHKEDHFSSKLSKSSDAAENGSAATNKEPSGEKIPADEDAAQLHKWVYSTSHEDLTLAENLEKSKWEGACCEGQKKNGE